MQQMEWLAEAGWTWYTGSSSWLFMAGIEGVLGICKKGDSLIINPCIPFDWEHYMVIYQFLDTVYEVNVYQEEAKTKAIKNIYCDNQLIQTNEILMENDKQHHKIDVIIG